jgi:hypothetical protein
MGLNFSRCGVVADKARTLRARFSKGWRAAQASARPMRTENDSQGGLKKQSARSYAGKSRKRAFRNKSGGVSKTGTTTAAGRPRVYEQSTIEAVSPMLVSSLVDEWRRKIQKKQAVAPGRLQGKIGWVTN